MRIGAWKLAGLFGALASLSLPASAQAACRVPDADKAAKVRFNVDKNDSVTYYRITDSGSPCNFTFTAGRTLTFRQAAIIRVPSVGTLKQTGDFAFRYTPQPGYRGVDTMGVKVCGQNRSGAGCSTISYEVTVN